LQESLISAGFEAGARRVALSVDMRYAGQNYELSVPLPAGPVTAATIDGFCPFANRPSIARVTEIAATT
jgi:hypothetical protein